jgi:hypothetical protein
LRGVLDSTAQRASRLPPLRHRVNAIRSLRNAIARDAADRREKRRRRNLGSPSIVMPSFSISLSQQ